MDVKFLSMQESSALGGWRLLAAALVETVTGAIDLQDVGHPFAPLARFGLPIRFENPLLARWTARFVASPPTASTAFLCNIKQRSR